MWPGLTSGSVVENLQDEYHFGCPLFEIVAENSSQINLPLGGSKKRSKKSEENEEKNMEKCMSIAIIHVNSLIKNSAGLGSIKKMQLFSLLPGGKSDWEQLPTIKILLETTLDEFLNCWKNSGRPHKNGEIMFYAFQTYG